MTEKRSARLRRGRYKKIFILVWRAPNPLPSVLLVWSLLTSTNGSFFASAKGSGKEKPEKGGKCPGKQLAPGKIAIVTRGRRAIGRNTVQSPAEPSVKAIFTHHSHTADLEPVLAVVKDSGA